MLDALVPAVDALCACYAQKSDASMADAAALASEKASEGAESTKAMQPAFGRSCYVPAEALKDVPDPGAVAVAAWIQAIAQGLQK